MHSAERAHAPAAGLSGDPFHRLLTTFAGVPAGQVWADYFLWELVLNAHPNLRAIVEIGTWQGGFSRYLASQAYWRGMDFTTYDATRPEHPLISGFVRCDVFAQPDVVIDRLAKWPTILLCDGGNKPRELATFGTLVGAGSLVVVHDWLTEVQPADVPDQLEPMYEDVCDALGSMSRVFKVRA